MLHMPAVCGLRMVSNGKIYQEIKASDYACWRRAAMLRLYRATP